MTHVWHQTGLNATTSQDTTYFRWWVKESNTIWAQTVSFQEGEPFAGKSFKHFYYLPDACHVRTTRVMKLEILPVAQVRVGRQVGVASRGTTRVRGFLVQLKSTSFMVMVGQVAAPYSCVSWRGNVEVAAGPAWGGWWDLQHVEVLLLLLLHNILTPFFTVRWTWGSWWKRKIKQSRWQHLTTELGTKNNSKWMKKINMVLQIKCSPFIV